MDILSFLNNFDTEIITVKVFSDNKYLDGTYNVSIQNFLYELGEKEAEILGLNDTEIYISVGDKEFTLQVTPFYLDTEFIFI